MSKLHSFMGDLEKEIYMEQPKGYIGLVYKLRKSYGLKQAPRQWYLKFDKFMLEHGLQKM